MSQPTKYFSSKQEHTIADYLGWSVVVGSGARDFHPGDIISEDFLGECKTHTAPKNKITITKSVWCKIQMEAESKFKRPVLFVDDGTQSIKNTWCVIPARFMPPDFDELVSLLDSTLLHESKTIITFNHVDMVKIMKDAHVYNTVVPLEINDMKLLLMSLQTFKHIFIGSDD